MLRMKSKHYQGATGYREKGKQLLRFNKDPPVPGCVKYEERKAAWGDLQKLQADTAVYNQRSKEIPAELGLKGKGEQSPVMTLKLKHGDMVFMHGADIQKYYEHSVVPEDKLRFALTCRQILPGHLKKEEAPPYEVGSDPNWYDGALLPLPPHRA
jgi:hypothetical protein